MKDKLIKHHKSRLYFRARRVLGISLILIAMTAAVAIPVGVTIYKELNIQQVNK